MLHTHNLTDIISPKFHCNGDDILEVIEYGGVCSLPNCNKKNNYNHHSHLEAKYGLVRVHFCECRAIYKYEAALGVAAYFPRKPDGMAMCDSCRENKCKR